MYVAKVATVQSYSLHHGHYTEHSRWDELVVRGEAVMLGGGCKL